MLIHLCTAFTFTNVLNDINKWFSGQLETRNFMNFPRYMLSSLKVKFRKLITPGPRPTQKT